MHILCFYFRSYFRLHMPLLTKMSVYAVVTWDEAKSKILLLKYLNLKIHCVCVFLNNTMFQISNS